MKFLVQVRADRPVGADGRDTTAEAVDVMRTLIADCASVGVPSVVENLIFPLHGEAELSPEAKADAVIEAAVLVDSLNPTLLKLEYPGSPEACRRLAERITAPWAVLSAGVSSEQFSEVLRISCDEGGASGFIAGRSVWRETVAMDHAERTAFLSDTGRRTARRVPHDHRGPRPVLPRGRVMTALFEARGLNRRFGRVQALDGTDFDVNEGEVVALIGDNGAGKSTLVKALTGNLDVESGEILYEGSPVHFATPQDASRLGIEVVHQDLALAPHLDSAQNMFLGREVMRPGLLGKLGFMDTTRMRDEAAQAFTELGSAVRSVVVPVGAMSGGQKQTVAIARAVAWANKLLFLDEPTAALGVVQTRNVLDTIKKVRDRGISVVLISHSMPHVLEVADRVQVLRLGRRVATYQAADTSVEQLVGAMTGALDDKEGAA